MIGLVALTVVAVITALALRRVRDRVLPLWPSLGLCCFPYPPSL